jgi:hypothetical protein
MTIEFSKKHWVTSGIFLAMYIFGLTIAGTRMGIVRDGWIYLGLFAAPA